MTTFERFMSKVKKTVDCWEWTAARFKTGYGAFGIGRTVHYAHRVAWRLFFGEIPSGGVIRHHCDNPRCVRPDHLAIGSKADNSGDMARRERGTQRFSLDVVRDVMRRSVAGESQRRIAKSLKTSQAEISYMINTRSHFLKESNGN